MTQDATTREVLAAAERGWRLIPIPPGTKAPRMKNWPERASSDREQLQRWLREFPGWNWGVATGRGSGIFVVDVDNEAALPGLKKFGKLPATRTVKTGRGYHFYFVYPAQSEIRNSVKEICTDVDVRSEGSQVVMPPSVHPSGAVYTLLHDHPVAAAPKWLLEKVTAPTTPSAKTPKEEDDDLSEGEGRNNALISLAGSLQRRGEPLDVIEAALLARNARFTPPLGEREVQGILKSISRYEPESQADGDTLLVLGDRRDAELVPDAERILKDRPAERIFQTPISRHLTRVIQHHEDPQEDKDVQRDPHTCLMVPLDASYLQLALGRTGKVFRRNRKGDLIPADATPQLAKLVLSSVETSPDMTSWNRLRKIALTPILLPNGTLVTEPGYHADSQIWFNPRGIEFLDPAAHNPKLTPKQCRALLEKTVHPFASEYLFAKERPEQQWYETAAWAVVLSGMMCIDDRHNLPSVPMHCVSAPTQACGKTRLVQALTVAVTGTHPTITTYDGAEESGKHLPVLLGKGDAAIVYDNVIMPINASKLAANLTQEHSFDYRPLGASDNRRIENTSVLFATGVNLQLSGDMPTRCLLARIEPETERPEEKRFPFDQVERAMDLFPRAVMAIKAVLRAHQLANYPGVKMLKTASRFPAWDRRVRAAIVSCGYTDPLLTQNVIRADDPLRADHVQVLYAVGDKFAATPFLICELPRKLDDDSRSLIEQITGHKLGETFNERKVGRYFSTHLLDRWFEGFRLIRTGKTPKGRTEWQLEMKQEMTCGNQEDPI